MGEHAELMRKAWKIPRERRDEMGLATHRNLPALQREGSRRPVFGRIFSSYQRSDVHTREEAAMAKIRVYTTPT